MVGVGIEAGREGEMRWDAMAEGGDFDTFTPNWLYLGC